MKSREKEGYEERNKFALRYNTTTYKLTNRRDVYSSKIHICYQYSF